MKKILLILFSFLFGIGINAQNLVDEPIKKNAVYLRLGNAAMTAIVKPKIWGEGNYADITGYSIYSINYDRIMLIKRNYKITVSAGLSYNSGLLLLDESSVAVPADFSILLPFSEKWHYEGGLGTAYYVPLKFRLKKQALSYYVNFIGIRRQSLKGGFFFNMKSGIYLGNHRYVTGDFFYDKFYLLYLTFGFGKSF